MPNSLVRARGSEVRILSLRPIKSDSYENELIPDLRAGSPLAASALVLAAWLTSWPSTSRWMRIDFVLTTAEGSRGGDRAGRTGVAKRGRGSRDPRCAHSVAALCSGFPKLRQQSPPTNGRFIRRSSRRGRLATPLPPATAAASGACWALV